MRGLNARFGAVGQIERAQNLRGSDGPEQCANRIHTNWIQTTANGWGSSLEEEPQPGFSTGIGS